MRCPVAAFVILALSAAMLDAADRSSPSERSLRDLIDALAHIEPAVRMASVDELGRRGDASALIPLIQTLRDVQPEVRAHAAEALRVLGDERAVPFLARLLSDPADLVRCRAVLALGDLAGKYVVPAVTRCLADPAAVVRAAAVRALGEIGEPLSIDAVIDAARREGGDPDRAVRAAALISSAKIAGSRGLRLVLAIVEEELDHAWFLRATAAHAWGIVGDRARVPELLETLETDIDPRVCQAAAGALARLDGQAELNSALDLPDPQRRQAAAIGLGALAGQEARRGLIRAAGDESPGVVLAAAAALLAQGEADAIPVLIGLLEEEAQVWLGALEVLEMRTGRSFGRNPPRWEAWFSDVRERLVFFPETGIYRKGAR